MKERPSSIVAQEPRQNGLYVKSWQDRLFRRQPENIPKRNRDTVNFLESLLTRDSVRTVHLRTITYISEAAHNPLNQRQAGLWGGSNGLNLGEPRKTRQRR